MKPDSNNKRETNDLQSLLATMNPRLVPGEFVFITMPEARYGVGSELNPIASFIECEGLTLIVPRSDADSAGKQYEGVFRLISLQVHSDLNAVGLTAAVAAALADVGISANVVAAFFHDHIFVPHERADEAIKSLTELQNGNG